MAFERISPWGLGVMCFILQEEEIRKLSNEDLIDRLIFEASKNNEFDNRTALHAVKKEVLRRFLKSQK